MHPINVGFLYAFFIANRLYDVVSETRTLATRINHQNQLVAGMFKDNTDGFKDPRDPCNKSNKSNGGDFVTYQR